MDQKKHDRLSELVEELTTSGEPQLNQAKMKEVKKICKLSNEYINHFYHLVMTQLNQDHAEIRFSAFQMTTELFSRSHHFRVLLVTNLQEFLELTVETDVEQPLPPPKEVARKLKTHAIQTVQGWQTTYGEAYKKLALGYHFLKQVKKVDFQDVESRTLAERKRQEEKQQRLERIYKEKLDKAKQEMEEMAPEMEESLTEMNSCMTLLVPDTFELFSTELAVSSERHFSTEPTVSSERLAALPGSEWDSSISDEQPCCSTDVSRGTDEQPCCSTDVSRGTDEQPCCSTDVSRGTDEQSCCSTDVSRGTDEQPCCSTDVSRGTDEQPCRSTDVSRGTDEQPCCSTDVSRGTDVRIAEASKDEEDEDDAIEESAVNAADEGTFIRTTGLMSRSYRLDLSISTDLKVKETEENEAVVTTMRDLHRLLGTKYLPMVQSWIQVFTKVGVEEQLMRQATNLKKSLEKALRKHSELNIDYKTRHRTVIKAEDEDDDFEEVPEKEGYEPQIPEHLRPEYGLDALPSTSTSAIKSNPSKAVFRASAPPVASSLIQHERKLRDEEQDPTCAAATLKVLKTKLGQGQEERNDYMGVSGGSAAPTVSSSEQGKEKVKAPIIPFGLDLYYWEEEQPMTGKIIKYTSQHQFWVPHEVEEEVENKELSAQMKSRHITFPGCFQPVKHKCKAPMPNGSLCERQDRVKCPFHGLIIPRDKLGRPINPEDAARLEKEEMKRREEPPDWYDLEFMKEVEAATGEDLGSSKTYRKGKGKGKKRKHPNLTDLKQTANTSRLRLEKKVFNKSSMRRIAEVMNKMDKKKHEKFANQFNYALK